ncbi:glutaminyl-peptide cyclotransferase [Candidatus Parabeggiatoa sp. HSG14]|uniref:glutaminyl-peptide cyclotransferase n=1 Tax=Candidatus Parabeggiatoa sp. HSG14 TaxID=3055593 RepID=UPI0025A6E573|nr:glutaminyl-peptide cyclotransferase [Thiotrichales bacterium HSG14]
MNQLKTTKIWKPKLGTLIFCFWGILASSYAETTPKLQNDMIPTYTYKIINTYPHDKKAFTQGLVFQDGFLYESTGLRNRSTLRKVELETGKVLQIHNLHRSYFGEGMTIYNGKIFQLTWQSQVGFVYDKASFELIEEFNYPTEGWGLTHDGKQLIMSDGTSTLYFLNPETLEITGQIDVYDNQKAIKWLNELEYIHGKIYANVWQSTKIAVINPKTGQVDGWIELEGLLSFEEYRADVLNGIAYDAKKNRLFVTGKLWPKLFEIKLIPLNKKSQSCFCKPAPIK